MIPPTIAPVWFEWVLEEGRVTPEAAELLRALAEVCMFDVLPSAMEGLIVLCTLKVEELFVGCDTYREEEGVGGWGIEIVVCAD